MFNEQHKKEMPLLGLLGLGGGIARAISAAGPISASGGVINDYEVSGTFYRAHIFQSSGSLVVSSGSGNVEIFAVGGGGGGSGGFPGFGPGKGGGAGGAFDATAYPISSGTYPVTIGAGGYGGRTGPASAPYFHVSGGDGGNTVFNSALTAAGGGGAGGGNLTDSPHTNGRPGGSGGGGGWRESGTAPQVTGGTATQPSQNPGVPNLTNYGFAGGNGDTSTTGGGGSGGGAGGAGTNYAAPPTTLRSGGPGISNVYAYGPGTPITYAAGGDANGPNTTDREDEASSSGNGGGGWANNPTPAKGASGGSGFLVVRYQLDASAGTAKATGGTIAFYGGKTIHIFTSSGTFNVTNGPISAEFFMVAGGGGAGFDASGGGGGGGVVYHPGLTVANGPYGVTIGSGGRGSRTQPVKGSPGGDSSIAFPTTYTASGGGGGGSRTSAPGDTGGSGGGGGRSSGTGGSAAQPAANPGATEYGNAGGTAGSYGAGGGGAGSAGQPYADYPNRVGWGGIGIQAPTTFRTPAPTGGIGGAIPGDPDGYWGFAGGGGGGGETASVESYGGSWEPSGGRIPGGPYYGGGTGAIDPPAITETNTNGWVNSGGGGGGGNNSPYAVGGNGGSGIVLIAYPT